MKARRVPGIAPGTRFGDAAATTVEVRAAEVFANAEGVLDTGDIERVHAMRVATRRLRAAMEVFAPCFPAKEHKRLLGEVKHLADALGARRDPDVAIEELAGMPGVRGVIAELRAEQEHGNEQVAAALQRVLDRDLAERLAALAQEARA